jgi:hypothetical protein
VVDEEVGAVWALAVSGHAGRLEARLRVGLKVTVAYRSREAEMQFSGVVWVFFLISFLLNRRKALMLNALSMNRVSAVPCPDVKMEKM